MAQLPILLGGAVLFATVVVLAAVLVACVGLLTWALAGALEVVRDVFMTAWHCSWWSVDSDDWIGLISAAVVMSAVFGLLFGIMS